MSEIRIVDGIRPPSTAPKGAAAGKTEGDLPFLKALQGALAETSDLVKAADASSVDMSAGKAGLHETLLAVEKADISFRLLMQVRNKVLDAYKEVMRMNV
jgi:flagellar hook-basal body complex protein FliE